MIRFQKWHGLGNDFVLLDAREDALRVAPALFAPEVCDRSLGIGADGVLVVDRHGGFAARMRVWNPDGSEAEMCGNGIRCVAALIGGRGSERTILTGSGPVRTWLLESEDVSVDMGRVSLEGPGDAVDLEFEGLSGVSVVIGNPHLVVFVASVSDVPLETWGPVLERHPRFPNGVNVHFVERVGIDHLRLRTWERGAGRTLACGTGACASAFSAYHRGAVASAVRVSLPGGDLRIGVKGDGTVHMTGPATYVFHGWWPLETS